jgi:DNA-directed RNA polymerase specialized sigma24 family protein
MPPKTPIQITGGVNRKEWDDLQLVWKENAALVNKLISQFLGQTPFNQDLAMDVFEVLLTTEDHLPSQDHIRRFLNKTNICRDHRKKMATREAHEGRVIYHFRSMENDDIEIAEATAYNQMLIRNKIAQIPGKCGKVCHMHWIQKLSKDEIALQMVMSESTVDNHLSAGRKFLKMMKKEPHRNFAYPFIIFLLIYLHEKI